MSVFPMPLDPAGINAAGNVGLFWVPAIADPQTGATIAELNAGINISNAVYAYDEGAEQSTTSRVKYGYKSERKSLGMPIYNIAALEYDDDPQGTAVGGQYAYKATLAEGAVGFLVHRRGVPPTTAFTATQKIDIRSAELGRQLRVAVAAGTEGEKLRLRQSVAVGDTWDARAVLAA